MNIDRFLEKIFMIVIIGMSVLIFVGISSLITINTIESYYDLVDNRELNKLKIQKETEYLELIKKKTNKINEELKDSIKVVED